MGELTDGKWRGLKQTAKVVERLRDCASVQSSGVDGLRSRQFALYLGLVSGIPPSAVIREQRDFVISGKMTENIVGTDLASGIYRQQLARFDPENPHTLTSKSPRSWKPSAGGLSPD